MSGGWGLGLGGGGGGLGTALATHTTSPGWSAVQLRAIFTAMKSSNSIPMLDEIQKQKSPARTVYCLAQPGRVETAKEEFVILGGGGMTGAPPTVVREYVKFSAGGHPHV